MTNMKRLFLIATAAFSVTCFAGNTPAYNHGNTLNTNHGAQIAAVQTAADFGTPAECPDIITGNQQQLEIITGDVQVATQVTANTTTGAITATKDAATNPNAVEAKTATNFAAVATNMVDNTAPNTFAAVASNTGPVDHNAATNFANNATNLVIHNSAPQVQSD